MADSASGGWRSGLRRLRRNFLPPAETNRSLHFFKIILPSSIRDEKLNMPKKFVRMFGQELSSNALLTVPNGGVWQVGLEKANGQIWFCDGWNKFIEYYSIEYGFLLVFRYERNSSFQVLIFDTTASEIQYPHDDALELGDEIQRSDSMTPIPSSSCRYSDRNFDDESLYQPHASKIACRSMKFEKNVLKNSSKSYGVETRSKSKRKLEIPGCGTESKRSKVEDCVKMNDLDVVENDQRQRLPSRTRTDGRNMAIRAATERLKTQNPSFMVIIERRNIEKFYAYIPSSFATKYLSGEEEIIEIQAGSEGRKWKICCHGSGRTSKRMGRGWRAFCRDNNVRAGDVVVFELVKRRNIRVLKSTVFPSVAK